MLVEEVPDVDMWTGEPASDPPRETPRKPYPSSFMNMHEKVQRNTNGPIHALRFAGGVDKDLRTYNSPSSAEISCVVVGEGPLPRQ